MDGVHSSKTEPSILYQRGLNISASRGINAPQRGDGTTCPHRIYVVGFDFYRHFTMSNAHLQWFYESDLAKLDADVIDAHIFERMDFDSKVKFCKSTKNVYKMPFCQEFYAIYNNFVQTWVVPNFDPDQPASIQAAIVHIRQMDKKRERDICLYVLLSYLNDQAGGGIFTGALLALLRFARDDRLLSQDDCVRVIQGSLLTALRGLHNYQNFAPLVFDRFMHLFSEFKSLNEFVHTLRVEKIVVSDAHYRTILRHLLRDIRGLFGDQAGSIFLQQIYMFVLNYIRPSPIKYIESLL